MQSTVDMILNLPIEFHQNPLYHLAGAAHTSNVDKQTGGLTERSVDSYTHPNLYLQGFKNEIQLIQINFVRKPH